MLTVSEPTFQYFCLEVPAIVDSDFAPPGVHYLDLHNNFKYSSCVFINVAFTLVIQAVPLLCGLIYLHARYISITSPDISPLLCLTMYYTSFISLYWPYLQLLAFFAARGGRSKLVLASIKPLDRSLFQQHKTFLTRHISLVKAFKWNPVLTRFIITKRRDFDKKSRWYIEKRSHFSHFKSTHCEEALRVWRRRTKRFFLHFSIMVCNVHGVHPSCELAS